MSPPLGVMLKKKYPFFLVFSRGGGAFTKKKNPLIGKSETITVSTRGAPRIPVRLVVTRSGKGPKMQQITAKGYAVWY